MNYRCPKCDNTTYELGEMRATGGTLSKIFDVQNKKFTSVTCKKCTYTEFFKARTSAISNIFDFFTNYSLNFNIICGYPSIFATWVSLRLKTYGFTHITVA